MNSGKICRVALEKWGAQKQTTKLFEEMAELQKELCKNTFGSDNQDQIAEEIADVTIMLEQMILLHDCEQKVIAWRKYKLTRLLDRIKNKE